MLKININGVSREMTIDEEMAYLSELATDFPETYMTPEDRITMLEEDNANLKADNAYLKEALDLLLSGVTEDE